MQSKTPQELAKKIKKGETVVKLTGWKGHATFVMFTTINGRLYCIKGNRGSKARKQPGVQVFEVGNEKNLPFVMKQLDDLSSTPAGKDFFVKEIDQQLGLKFVTHIHQDRQTVGNCGWASLEMVFLALVYAEFAKNRPQAGALASTCQDKFRTYNRTRSLCEYAKTTKKPDCPLLGEIQSRVTSNKVFAQIQEPLIRVIDQARAKGKKS